MCSNPLFPEETLNEGFSVNYIITLIMGVSKTCSQETYNQTVSKKKVKVK